MDRAEKLCTVFTQFCDYNMSTVGSSSHLVSCLSGCACLQGKKLRSGLLQAALIPAHPDNEPVSRLPPPEPSLHYPLFLTLALVCAVIAKLLSILRLHARLTWPGCTYHAAVCNMQTSGDPVATGPLASCQHLAEHLQTPAQRYAEPSQ